MPSLRHTHSFASALRFTPSTIAMRRCLPILFSILLGQLFTSTAQAVQPLTILPHSQQVIPLNASPDTAILCIEGRLVNNYEAPPRTAIRLILNRTLLEGDRIIGPRTIVLPTNPKADYPPRPRYTPADRCFAFPIDADYIAGNGPFWGNEGSRQSVGCPHLLQLRVGDLLRAKGNELTVINGSKMTFEVRCCSLAATPETSAEPLVPNPAWTLFYYSPEMCQSYETAVQQGKFTPAERAHILAAIGTGELLRDGGDRAKAIQAWQQALATSTTFDLRGEAAYRLAAERLRAGKWADERTEALVRAAAVGDESWAELAAALLKIIDGNRADEEKGRLIIRPALVQGAQVVDAVLDEPFWKVVPTYKLNYSMGKARLPYYATDVRFAVREDGLALGFTGDIPEGACWTAGINRDANVWDDNAVEFFVSPDTDIRYYYELNASPMGGQYDGKHHWWWDCNPGWNGQWKVAGRVDGAKFTIEYAIPWTDLGFTAKPASGTVFIVAVTRYAVTGKDDDSVGKFFTLTKHRDYDCHRMMDGAVLVIP